MACDILEEEEVLEIDLDAVGKKGISLAYSQQNTNTGNPMSTPFFYALAALVMESIEWCLVVLSAFEANLGLQVLELDFDTGARQVTYLTVVAYWSLVFGLFFHYKSLTHYCRIRRAHEIDVVLAATSGALKPNADPRFSAGDVPCKL